MRAEAHPAPGSDGGARPPSAWPWTRAGLGTIVAWPGDGPSRPGTGSALMMPSLTPPTAPRSFVVDQLEVRVYQDQTSLAREAAASAAASLIAAIAARGAAAA